MRGIRAPRENLSEKNKERRLPSRRVIETPVWRPPLLGCRGWRRQLKHGGETGQLARDAAQLGRAFGRLGRSTALAGIFRHVLEADLLSRAPIRSHGC